MKMEIRNGIVIDLALADTRCRRASAVWRQGQDFRPYGDFAKGIKSFKKGLADEETPPAAAPQSLDHRPSVEADSGVPVAEGELISSGNWTAFGRKTGFHFS